jgi:hypothetical protein
LTENKFGREEKKEKRKKDIRRSSVFLAKKLEVENEF